MTSKGIGRTAMTGFVGTQTKKRPSEYEEQGEHLLPGIPDEITLNHIVTQLPWSALHILPSLCRGWNEAIQSRQVYDARVCHHATETLVVLHHKAGPMNFFALYSMRDKSFYFLPAMPNVEWGDPSSCQCIALEGKIYVLGGVHSSSRSNHVSEKVYVLDLVGQRQWKQCASMLVPRAHFGCGVVDGKIYVIGGRCEYFPFYKSEVYDPKEDAWSLITEMPTFMLDGLVLTLGEELFVYTEVSSPYFHVYHPAKNEWRELEYFGRKGGVIFVANGKFHAMTLQNFAPPMIKIVTHVYNMDNKSWTHLQSSTLAEHFAGHFRSSDDVTVSLCAILAVDDELLVRVRWATSNYGTSGNFLVQSKGFGVENKQIVWEKVKSSLSFSLVPSMCYVQL